MIKIQLTYHLYHSWKTENATSVIGTAFKNDELLKETALLHNFQTIPGRNILIEIKRAS